MWFHYPKANEQSLEQSVTLFNSILFFFFLRYRENNGDGHVLYLCGNEEEKTGSFSWFHARCSQK